MSSQYEGAATIEPINGADIAESPIKRLADVVRRFLVANRVKMADGSATTKMCSACEMMAVIAHQGNEPSCQCVCHAARQLLVELELNA